MRRKLKRSNSPDAILNTWLSEFYQIDHGSCAQLFVIEKLYASVSWFLRVALLFYLLCGLHPLIAEQGRLLADAGEIFGNVAVFNDVLDAVVVLVFGI